MPRTSLICVGVLLLVGCSAPNARREFRQGAGVPVEAPEFDPAFDAPITTGQPGFATSRPERSTHTRVLPETPQSRREAGIWAGDEPSLASLSLLREK